MWYAQATESVHELGTMSGKLVAGSKTLQWWLWISQIHMANVGYFEAGGKSLHSAGRLTIYELRLLERWESWYHFAVSGISASLSMLTRLATMAPRTPWLNEVMCRF